MESVLNAEDLGEMSKEDFDAVYSAVCVEAGKRGMLSEGEEPTEAPIKWTRGKLPGNRYVKTNGTTGEMVDISSEEFDALS